MKFLILKKRKVVAFLLSILALVVSLTTMWTSGAHVVMAGHTTRKLPIYCVDTNEKNIALTFDASWGADKTLKILEVLQNYDIRATFFCVGFWAEKYSDTLKKLSESGRMEIGTHSNTHPHMSKLSSEQIVAELDTSISIIKGITGKEITLFRAPFGEYSDKVLDVAESKGLYTIQWDVDTLDWKGLTASQISARVLKKANKGSIVLMHNDGKHTVDALPLIIEGLKNKGYNFVCVSELIYKDNYEIDHTGKQIRIEG